MKRTLAVSLSLVVALSFSPCGGEAAVEAPTVYTIEKGDTLWGLSRRFLTDPYYWPNMWATNPYIGNPHFIYPGQRLRVFKDRVEIEGGPVLPRAAGETPREGQGAAPVVPGEEGGEVQREGVVVTGSEGFLLEEVLHPAGFIVSTHHDRVMVGTDDIVYTDIGRIHGANVGDRFAIYRKGEAVSHPVTNVILGHRVTPLGELQLSELEERTSKALVTKAYQEISAGSYLLPWRERRVTVHLKAADRDLTGYIVETQTGIKAVAGRDIVYLDLGSSHGLKAGNLLYVVRDVMPDQRYALTKLEQLPDEVLGAVVVLETGVNSSTAVIVKSVDTIYRGDRVELKMSR